MLGKEAVWWQAVTIGIRLYGGRGEAERLSGRTGSFAILLDGGLGRPGLSVSADDSIPVKECSVMRCDGYSFFD